MTTPQDQPGQTELAADIARLDGEWNEITGDWSPLSSEYLKWMAEELAAAGYRKTPAVDDAAVVERMAEAMSRAFYRIWPGTHFPDTWRSVAEAGLVALSRDIGGQP